MKRIFVVVLIALIISGPTWGQNAPPTVRYTCIFKVMASPDGLEDAKDFKLEFILETASGKGMIIGNQGFSKVYVINGPFAITFIEPLKTGAAQTTTITRNRMAVHSRNTAMNETELIPSQYYGSCTVK
ncbi:MAG: hypothetical protein HOF84_07275 [Rhodospirillales bacterium]|jgi:hypothetical protein|nr:hypothetical protein [Rhodospirillales bacterium]